MNNITEKYVTVEITIPETITIHSDDGWDEFFELLDLRDRFSAILTALKLE